MTRANAAFLTAVGAGFAMALGAMANFNGQTTLGPLFVGGLGAFACRRR